MARSAIEAHFGASVEDGWGFGRGIDEAILREMLVNT